MTFYSSDFHLGHEKVIGFSQRPFADALVMNNGIIANMNAAMGVSDTLYMLGDWCCGIGPDKVNYIRATRARLNVGTVHLIIGNHDPSAERLRPLVDDATLASVSYAHCMRIPGSKREMFLSHYPWEDWGFEEAGTVMLHGHRHGAGVRHATRRRLDVGVDGHGYAPWSLDEVMDEMRRTPWKAVSHHA